MVQIGCVVLCLAICLGLNVPLAVQAAPSKDKCSCDLNKKGDGEDGAEVRNAAACELTSDDAKDWCKFDVDKLKGSSSHRTFVQQFVTLSRLNDGRNLANLLSGTFRKLHERRVAIAKRERLPQPSQDVLKQINVRLGHPQTVALLRTCGRIFAGFNSGKTSNLMGDDVFRCGVHENGWLTIEFGFGKFQVFYILAPWPSR